MPPEPINNSNCVVGDPMVNKTTEVIGTSLDLSKVQQPSKTIYYVTTEEDIKLLEEELSKLRNSTKQALRKSWEENEALEKKLADQDQVISRFEEEVSRARLKSQQWKARCRKAEDQLARQEEINKNIILAHQNKKNGNEEQTKTNEKDDNESPVIYEHGKGSLRSFMMKGWGKKNDKRNDNHDPSQEDSSVTKEQKTPMELIQNLETKITSRDAAIASMEGTLQHHVRTMHTIQREVERLRQRNDFEDKLRHKEKDMETMLCSFKKEASVNSVSNQGGVEDAKTVTGNRSHTEIMNSIKKEISKESVVSQNEDAKNVTPVELADDMCSVKKELSKKSVQEDDDVTDVTLTDQTIDELPTEKTVQRDASTWRSEKTIETAILIQQTDELVLHSSDTSTSIEQRHVILARRDFRERALRSFRVNHNQLPP